MPPLVDVIPEARLNLVIFYLKNDQTTEAYNLIKDMECVVPKDYILKAVVHALAIEVLLALVAFTEWEW